MAPCAVSSDHYYRRVRLVLYFVLALNLLVTSMKLAVGYLTNSASIVADGYHSLTDSLSNVTALIGIYVASRPKDVSHPYGHQKFETIASGVISLMLVLIAVWILLGAAQRFIAPSAPDVTWLSFAVMGVTIIINFLVSHYELKEGKRLGSDILTADAMFTRSDILVSLSVIASLAASYIGFPIVDTLTSAIIALLIARAAFTIFKQSADVLSDGMVIDPAKIKLIVDGVTGVVSCHDIRSHGRQDHIYIDLHVLLSKDLTVEAQHAIDHEIEKKIKDTFAGVAEVFIHVEPAD